jgi:DNA repair protein RadC
VRSSRKRRDSRPKVHALTICGALSNSLASFFLTSSPHLVVSYGRGYPLKTVGCSCQKPPENPVETGTRITAEASEPLVAVYESESAENPSVFGCGSSNCGPTSYGHPTAIRVQRISMTGIVQPNPTDIELPATLQEAYSNGNTAKSPACLPWVRVTRDPARFSSCLAEARKIGPIQSPKKVYELFKQQGLSEDQEVFYVLLLDTQFQCRGVGEISRGARDRVQTPIPDLLRLPLVDGAITFIVVHNHPSGKVNPSEADKQVTVAINEAGKAVGVPLFDHVIIGTDSYYSFLEKTRLIK